MIKRFLCIVLLASACSFCVAEDSVRVLIVVGPSNHPPGSHEVAAGGRLMQHCLRNAENVTNVKAEVVYRWPNEELRQWASTIVFIGDTFPPNRLDNPKQKLAQVEAMMQRGCGIVCVHYATGLRGEDVESDGDHPLLRWLGGYFANRTCPHHESFARIYEAATITPVATDLPNSRHPNSRHPILRGWNEFTLHDEPYINNYFGKDENRLADNVTALATSMLPPAQPKQETVAWCVDREDGGRGFAIVMPHFYKNWGNEDLRRFILNGIVWTAQAEVPEGGVETTLPPLETFRPEAVEFRK